MNVSDTAGMRTIAKEVVSDQQRVCAMQMRSIEDKLDGVVEDMTTVKSDVGSIKTEQAVLKVRLTIGAAVAAALPVIVVLVRDWWIATR